ncbi:hypothetical protein AB1Y20_022167 [Prymnesium parvum]|uniref:PH domain-containing protein n=1 Tax=Prymnesium parvum TaxID=97485 RepID=A0AB34JIQ1_PRYPA
MKWRRWPRRRRKASDAPLRSSECAPSPTPGSSSGGDAACATDQRLPLAVTDDSARQRSTQSYPSQWSFSDSQPAGKPRGTDDSDVDLALDHRAASRIQRAYRLRRLSSIVRDAIARRQKMPLDRPPLPGCTEEALVEGWMLKRATGFPYAWQTRYFVFLPQRCLLCSYAIGEGRRRKATLQRAFLLKLASAGTPAPLLSFIVEGLHGVEQEIVAFPVDEDERDRWIRVIGAYFAVRGEPRIGGAVARSQHGMKRPPRRRQRRLGAAEAGRPALPGSSGEALIEGWMVKRASRFPFNWLRRYFTFIESGRLLEYFDTYGRLRGRVEVSRVRGVRATKGMPLRVSFELKQRLVTGGRPVPEERRKDRLVLHLLAYNELDQRRWLDVLSSSLRQDEPRANSRGLPVLMQGWLQRQSPTFPYRWRTFFMKFEASQDALYIYTTENGTLRGVVQVLGIRPARKDALGLVVSSSPYISLDQLNQEAQTAHQDPRIRSGIPLRLRANTLEERQRWLHVIDDHLAS